MYNSACFSSVLYQHLVILRRPYPLSCKLYFVYLAVFHLSVLIDNDWICGTWRLNMKPSEIFEVEPKKDETRITYVSDTNSLIFWPIYHRRLTDIPLTINVQRISRVSAAISTEISADSRSICRPSLGRYLGWYIGQYVDWHISANISTDTRPICRLTYRSSVGRYVELYIGRVSVDVSTEMSTDISVEGCTKYTWSQIYMTAIRHERKERAKRNCVWILLLTCNSSKCFWVLPLMHTVGFRIVWSFLEVLARKELFPMRYGHST